MCSSLSKTISPAFRIPWWPVNSLTEVEESGVGMSIDVFLVILRSYLVSPVGETLWVWLVNLVFWIYITLNSFFPFHFLKYVSECCLHR